MGDPLELNRAVLGGRVEMFAIEDHDYPGDCFYRFSSSGSPICYDL